MLSMYLRLFVLLVVPAGRSIHDSGDILNKI